MGIAHGGVQDSNPITISIVDLPKPSIAGNSSYCLDGTTSLSVDEASLTLIPIGLPLEPFVPLVPFVPSA